MGQDLFETSPVFRRAIDDCAQVLRACMDTPLTEILFGKDQRLLDQTAYAQPALFAFEYALAQLWRSWGIEPAVVAGHSLGEYVAACIAGLFSLQDGLTLVAARGRLMQSSMPGRMAAVACSRAVAEEAILRFSCGLSVAAVNGPNNVVISGLEDPLNAVLEMLAKRGVESRPLRVSRAFHSPLMDGLLESFERAANAVVFHPLTIPIASGLTGRISRRPNDGERHLLERALAPAGLILGRRKIDRGRRLPCLRRNRTLLHADCAGAPLRGIIQTACSCLRSSRDFLPGMSCSSR